MIAQNELKAEEIRMMMQEVAQEHLPFEADGYICTGEMIYDVLMKAATDGISISHRKRNIQEDIYRW